jgi:hypothetical protein
MIDLFENAYNMDATDDPDGDNIGDCLINSVNKDGTAMTENGNQIKIDDTTSDFIDVDRSLTAGKEYFQLSSINSGVLYVMHHIPLNCFMLLLSFRLIYRNSTF